MASSMLAVPGNELSAETLLALFEETELTAERGPDDMGNVKVDIRGVTFLIDPYPEQSVIKIWTARELDPDAIDSELATKSANSFNQVFLFVRNFIYQDPADPANYRAVWDHDHLVGIGGLTAEDLVAALFRVSDVMWQALGQEEQVGHA